MWPFGLNAQRPHFILWRWIFRMKQYLKRTIHLFADSKKQILIVFIQLILLSLISMMTPFITQKLIDNGFSNKNISIIIFYAVFELVVYITYTLIMFTKEKSRLSIYNKIKIRMETESFVHILKINRAYFDNKHPASIYKALDEDIQSISAIMGDDTLSAITSLFISIGGYISLFIINWKLALLVCAYLPIKYIITQLISNKNLKFTQDYIDRSRDYSGWFGETIEGIEDVRNLNLGNQKVKVLTKKQNGLVKANYKRVMTNCFNVNIEVVLIQIMITAIYIVSGFLLLNSSISLGEIIAVESYALMISSPISDAINLIFSISSLTPSIRRYFDFMDEDEEVNGEIEAVQINNISFKKVTFSYSEKSLLDDIDLVINSGEKIAIVGENGAGKSTLVSLLSRVYRPLHGGIYINDVNINDFKAESFFSMIGIVRQKVFLFNDTIRNNICCNRSVDEEVLLDICDKLNLSELIKEKTLDYCVGNDGANLSGGQKQKIAIARALIQKPQVLILDEATSNLDQKTKDNLLDLFDTLLKGITVICITHEEKIIKRFNSTYYLVNGRIESKWEK